MSYSAKEVLRNIKKVLRKCWRSVQRVSCYWQRIVKEELRKWRGTFEKCQGSLKEVQRKCQGNVEEVWRKCTKIFRKCQECVIEVSKVLRKCQGSGMEFLIFFVRSCVFPSVCFFSESLFYNKSLISPPPSDNFHGFKAFIAVSF